ncbi:MAG: DUF4149 domain-containing protein [Pseudomonadota bacterium]
MIELGGITVTLALAIWVGAIVFQSAVVAPSVFKTLEADSAGRFLRGLFPRFFQAGLFCGFAMLAGAAVLFFAGVRDGRLSTLAIVTAVMVALQFTAGRMVPAINAARDAGEDGRKRFGQLHGINVLLTIAVLLLGIGMLAALATAVPLRVGA